MNQFIPWPKEKTARLKALLKEGLTYRQIAQEMGDGLTRSAIAGRIRRAGLNANSTGPRIKKPSLITLSLPHSNPMETKLPSPVPKEEEYVGTVSLLSASDKQCRWPTRNQDGEAFVCGSATFKGSMCRDHWVRSHQPPAKKPGAEAAE